MAPPSVVSFFCSECRSHGRHMGAASPRSSKLTLLRTGSQNVWAMHMVCKAMPARNHSHISRRSPEPARCRLPRAPKPTPQQLHRSTTPGNVFAHLQHLAACHAHHTTRASGPLSHSTTKQLAAARLMAPTSPTQHTHTPLAYTPTLAYTPCESNPGSTSGRL